MKKTLIGLLSALVLLSFAAPVGAIQMPTLPRGDSFWAVSADSKKIIKINPVTGKRLKSIKIRRQNERIIGAGWDSKRRQFAFVDGWDSTGETNAGQDLITYSLRTKKWKRYTLDFGTLGNTGFDVRDVAVTSQGDYWFAVSPWDELPSSNVMFGPSSPGRFDTTINMADAAQVPIGSGETEIFNSISFVSDDSLLVAFGYDYGLSSLSLDGNLVSSQEVYASLPEASHFDLASDGSFWIYADYGTELSWGVLGSPDDNQLVRETNCVPFFSCSETFFIQRGR